MRILLWVIVVAAAAWSGYWFVGKTGVEQAARAWFDDRQAQGWVARYDALHVQGYPNRFDLVLRAPELADPDRGYGWSGPRLDVLALSYKPNHIIMAFPPVQNVTTPLGQVQIASDDMKASLVTAPAPGLPLERLALVAEDLSLEGAELAGPITMSALRIGVDRIAATEARYRFAASAEGLRPGGALTTPNAVLPDTVETLETRMIWEFDRPWDSAATGPDRPRPISVTLDTLRLRWGDIGTDVTGELQFEDGLPEGKLTARLDGWRQVLDLARDMLALPDATADALSRALEIASALSGDGDGLKVSFDFRDGRIWLGPVPIARAPRLQ